MSESVNKENVAVGIKQSTKALNAGNVEYIIMAEDVERGLLDEILGLCREKGIAVKKTETMKLLGKSVGIDVGAAVVAVLK